MHGFISQKHTDLNDSKKQLSWLLCPGVAKSKSENMWCKLSWWNTNPPALGLLFLSKDRRRDEPRWPAPTSTWPLLDGVGGGTYVEFFILRDDFSIGEDGGRRAFGEWISWKDKADKSM